MYSKIIELQKELKNPALDGKAVIYSQKGNREYAYSTLPKSLEYVRSLATKHGLCVLQDVHTDYIDSELLVSVCTIIADDQGNKLELGHISAPVPQGAVNPIQALGSVITYLRRYSLMSALNIAGDEDTDANELTIEQEKQVEQVKKDNDAKKNELLKKFNEWKNGKELDDNQIKVIIEAIKRKPAHEAERFLNVCIEKYNEKHIEKRTDDNKEELF